MGGRECTSPPRPLRTGSPHLPPTNQTLAWNMPRKSNKESLVGGPTYSVSSSSTSYKLSKTTFSNEYLGSCINEEPSKMRYLVWSVESCESLSFRTEVALEAIRPRAHLPGCHTSLPPLNNGLGRAEDGLSSAPVRTISLKASPLGRVPLKSMVSQPLFLVICALSPKCALIDPHMPPRQCSQRNPRSNGTTC